MLSTVYLLRGRFGKGPEGHSSVINQLGVTHNMQSVLAHSAVPRDPFVNNCEKCSRMSQPGNLLCLQLSAMWMQIWISSLLAVRAVLSLAEHWVINDKARACRKAFRLLVGYCWTSPVRVP